MSISVPNCTKEEKEAIWAFVSDLKEAIDILNKVNYDGDLTFVHLEAVASGLSMVSERIRDISGALETRVSNQSQD